MTSAEFSKIAPSLPAQPGIYKYFNAGQELIYVGKARNIRKRVSSYFSKTFAGKKTEELVRRISSIEFTIVNNEHDALLLENSLIKEFKPMFNINLKDDKTYPYIVIKKEAFPRVFFTRRKTEDGSRYLGPYTSVAVVRDLLELIRESIPLRSCKLNLSEKNIRSKKFKVCLEYHLGRCKGPCEGLQTQEDYDAGIARVTGLLKGNLGPVLNDLKQQVKEYSSQMEFEKAQLVQQRIDNLLRYRERSPVANTRIGTADVFNILEEGDTAYVNYLCVSHGSIIHTKTIVLVKQLEESAEEVLAFAVARLRDSFESEAREIIVPFSIDYPGEEIRITVPRSGDRKKLLELARKNVDHYKEELRARKMLRLEDKTASEKKLILEQLQKDLHLPGMPNHIECFDNSNFQGSYPVSAMVCFREGEPSKKDYRKYNIRSVTGINDFASMQEVILRRYKRLLAEGTGLPNLVIIDGGKGQLNAALESLEQLGIRKQIPVIGLAKNQEEIFFPGDKESIKLPWNSESLKLIRRIRDEVHRFGITFHRSKRTAASVISGLETIKGIGPGTASLLLKHFRSVKKIKEADPKEIIALIGPSKATILMKALGAQP